MKILQEQRTEGKRQDRLVQVDILRAISILWIVGYWHLFDYTKAFPGYNNEFSRFLTVTALGLFVFISGWLIARKEEFKTKQQIKTFLTKKIFRIYPLYVIALLVTAYRSPDNAITIVKGLGLISMFWKPAPLTFWFISMIINFYLFSIFWIPFLSRTKKINQFLPLVGFALFLILLKAYSVSTGLLDNRLLEYFPCFTISLTLAHLIKEKGDTFKRKNFFVCVYWLIFSMLCYSVNRSLSLVISTMFVVPALVFLPSLLKLESFLTQIKGIRFFLIISYSSYCMYLFHRIMFKILKYLYFPESSMFQVIYLVGFCLPLIVIFSFLTQSLYDRVFNLFDLRTKKC